MFVTLLLKYTLASGHGLNPAETITVEKTNALLRACHEGSQRDLQSDDTHTKEIHESLNVRRGAGRIA